MAAPSLHTLFGVLGNATALFLFLSPMVTFRRIIRKRTTEDFSVIPYNMTLLNCLLSAWYGLPMISPNNMLVLTINGTGAAIELAYVLVFMVYAPRKARAQIFGLLSLVAAISAAVGLVSLLVLHAPASRFFCGSAAAIFSICMYASPLLIVRMVIKTKSVEYMPFPLTLFIFLCGSSWFIYGLLASDLFITVPNGCGSVLGAAQLILYAIYRKKKDKRGAAKGIDKVDEPPKAKDHINGEKINSQAISQDHIEMKNMSYKQQAEEEEEEDDDDEDIV